MQRGIHELRTKVREKSKCRPESPGVNRKELKVGRCPVRDRNRWGASGRDGPGMETAWLRPTAVPPLLTWCRFSLRDKPGSCWVLFYCFSSNPLGEHIRQLLNESSVSWDSLNPTNPLPSTEHVSNPLSLAPGASTQMSLDSSNLMPLLSPLLIIPHHSSVEAAM